MDRQDFELLVECTRGAVVESVHFGAMAVVDTAGRLVASCGNPDVITYPRSSAKPFQVLPFVERGGLEHFDINDRELALMCSSHSGTDEHVKVLTGLQAKIGVTVDDLLCGSHAPYHEPTARGMLLRGEPYTPARHNCSGKHTGMLAHALLRDLSKEDYINPEHPIQKTIFATFAEMIDYPLDKIALGTDGCSAPVFAAPLRNVAFGYARLADPSALPEPRAGSLRRIARAMAANPDMVAGPQRFDTLAMQQAAGRLVSKAGAEGYQGMALLPGALGPGSPALGIAFKIADGDLGGRARPTVAAEVLRQLGLLDAEQMKGLSDFETRPIYNWRHIEVGQIRPVFHLNRAH